MLFWSSCMYRRFDCLLWELLLTLAPICWQMGTKSLYYRGSVLPTLKMTSYVEMSISSDHWREAIYCVKPPIWGLIWTNFCQTQYFYDILWGAQMRIQWRRVRKAHLLEMKRLCHIRLSAIPHPPYTQVTNMTQSLPFMFGSMRIKDMAIVTLKLSQFFFCIQFLQALKHTMWKRRLAGQQWWRWSCSSFGTLEKRPGSSFLSCKSVERQYECNICEISMEMCIFFMVKVELYASISKMQSVEQMTHIFLSDVLLLDVQA